MNRAQRLSVALVALVIGVLAVLALTLVGPRSEGPVARVMAAAASLVRGAEHRAVQRYRGRTREVAMAWFGRYRESDGALRAPADLLLGAYDGGIPGTLQGVLDLEQALGTTFPLIQVYTAWGDAPEQQFPLKLVQAIWSLGSVPVITWEPWLSTFENRLHPELPLREDRDAGGLAAVAAGLYDPYIDRWAADAAKWDRPIFLRFAHEMNDPYRYPWGPPNNQPEHFIAAWRHVVERFRQAGAGKVIWVWSPHVAHAGIEQYYPGNDVVDWVGTGALNYGTVAYWSQWWSFADIFGLKYDRLAAPGKPIMIAEFGSLAVGGDRRRWYEAALAGVARDHPAVRALLFFNAAHDQTVTQQALDWTFVKDSLTLAGVRGQLRQLGGRAVPANNSGR